MTLSLFYRIQSGKIVNIYFVLLCFFHGTMYVYVITLFIFLLIDLLIFKIDMDY